MKRLLAVLMLAASSLLLGMLCNVPAFAGDGAGAGAGGWARKSQDSKTSGIITLSLGDKTLEVPQALWDQFEVLADLDLLPPQGPKRSAGTLEENEILNVETFSVLLDLIQSQRFENYPSGKILDAIFLSDYLQLTNQLSWAPFLAWLRAHASPELAMAVKDRNSILHLLLIEACFPSKYLANIYKIYWQPQGGGYWAMFKNQLSQIYNAAGKAMSEPADRYNWQPQGDGYWAIFKNGTARRYSATGEPIGAPLVNVLTVDWHPQQDGYWVRFSDESAQIYNATGEPTSALLANVFSIDWQPQGNGYLVRFNDGTARRYNATGEPTGALLANVFSVYWQPHGSSYWVIFHDETAQLYNALGEPTGAALENALDIDWQPQGIGYWVLFHSGSAQIYNATGEAMSEAASWYNWQPQGDGYWAILRDGTARRYNAAGRATGDVLANVMLIDWQPQGGGFWTHFNDESIQIYNAAGEPIGDVLINVLGVDWQPQGNGYLVRFKDDSAQLYSAVGEPIGDVLINVLGVDWEPHGNSYWVRFKDGTAILYERRDFSDLPLSEQMLVQYIINRKYNADQNKPLSERAMNILSPPARDKLQIAGYLPELRSYQVGDYKGYYLLDTDRNDTELVNEYEPLDEDLFTGHHGEID